MATACFLGHRFVYGNIEKELDEVIEKLINEGYDKFLTGTHGAFDSLAINACRRAKVRHPNIKIEVIITSYHTIEKDKDFGFAPYRYVETVMYEIEDVYFKKQITVSNKKMIDDSETLVCYVNEKRTAGGAIKGFKYAKKNGKEIINLYSI